jgi:hypothetical protein
MADKVSKTYQSKQSGFSTSVQVGEKRVAVQFIARPKGHGEFTTDDPAVQAHLERLPAFARGDIRVKWTPVEKAEARVKAAKEALGAAQAELKDAEAELAALKSPKKAAAAA